MKIILKNIFSLITVIIIFLTVYQVLKLDVLPNKYLFLFLGIEIVLFAISCFLYNRKKILPIIIGAILYILIIVGNVFGYYYLSKINKYIDDSFTQETYKVEVPYYLLTSINNPTNSIKELDTNSQVDYYKYSRSIEQAMKKLGKHNYLSIDTVIESLKEIQNTNKYLLIGKADYNYLFENTKVDIIKKEDYKIIKEFIVIEELKVNKETPDTYNVYLNGLDFTGLMRDYNLIATINTKTRKIVLTSIPRDFYMEVPGYNIKDTLMCLGSLDAEISKEALEKLLDIKIDYTINLNTTSLVKIVDSLGGLDFCSDYDFITTHALVLDTYDDRLGRKLHVTKGCKQYNGIEILTIARERNAFPGRDRYRQKNCRQILINIVKKIASTTTLTNYDEVINSLAGLYTTDMNDKTIKQLVKTALEDFNFEIIEQSVDGEDSIGVGHLGTQESWIMTPNMDTVNQASNTIKTVLNEK